MTGSCKKYQMDFTGLSCRPRKVVTEDKNGCSAVAVFTAALPPPDPLTSPARTVIWITYCLLPKIITARLPQARRSQRDQVASLSLTFQCQAYYPLRPRCRRRRPLCHNQNCRVVAAYSMIYPSTASHVNSLARLHSYVATYPFMSSLCVVSYHRTF
jgi:hypothetical protein